MKTIFYKLNRFFNGQWRLAVLDPDTGRWLVDHQHLPYLKAQNARGRHIVMQPAPSIESLYLMADDLDASLLDRHHRKSNATWKPGRLIVETSPANFQVWIRSARPLSLDEKKYWLRKMHSDPAATPKHRWGRCPGFFNKKPKYHKPNDYYPLAKLIWVDWKNTAKIPILHKESYQHHTPPAILSPLPCGDVCQINRSDYAREDESATDLAYALALARRKYSKELIKQRLLQERSDWTNHDGENRKKLYLDRTINKAISLIQSD